MGCSFLGPLLFILYTSKLFDIVHALHPQVHCYADDTQLYLSFSPDVVEDRESAILAMESCIDDMSQWMFANGLL